MSEPVRDHRSEDGVGRQRESKGGNGEAVGTVDLVAESEVELYSKGMARERRQLQRGEGIRQRMCVNLICSGGRPMRRESVQTRIACLQKAEAKAEANGKPC